MNRVRHRAGWAALAFLLGLGCHQGTQPHAKGRVLLIGLDGATLRVVEPLMHEGRLPNLSRIAAEGVHGPLQSFPPLHSPRIWNTIATGKVPEKHGILSFARARADGSQSLYLSSDRLTHALWNITSDAGLTTAVLNWWTTFPPERINGVMVTDHLLPEQVAELLALFQAPGSTPAAPTTYPPSWEARALQLAQDPSALVDLPNPLLSLEPFPRWYSRDGNANGYFRRDTGVTRIALAVESELHPAVAMVYLSGIDKLSHVYWVMVESGYQYSEAMSPTPEEKIAGAEALRGYYVYTDRLIGLLLDRYGPEDLIMVVSDHGFEASETPIQVGAQHAVLTGQHESDAASRGILFARGPEIRRGASVEGTTVNDIAPTILTWLGLPVAADMDGKPASFLGSEPPSRIATYDTKPVERIETESRGAEQEIIENLRALGYIK